MGQLANSRPGPKMRPGLSRRDRSLTSGATHARYSKIAKSDCWKKHRHKTNGVGRQSRGRAEREAECQTRAFPVG